MVDGIKFDSKKEAARYGELKTLEKAGKIRGLELQPTFVLQPSFQDRREGLTKTGQPKVVRAISYVADFRYVENGHVIVEDVKSEATRNDAVYKMKKKLLFYRYKSLDFREI